MFQSVHNMLAVSCTDAVIMHESTYVYNVGYIVELQYWGNFIVGVKARGAGALELYLAQWKSHRNMHWTKVKKVDRGVSVYVPFVRVIQVLQKSPE